MTIKTSPLDLILDEQNPRFLAIDQRSQDAIRKYMAMYEDVCNLATDINNSNGLLLGERIVVIHENNQYVVMEGNRRTCALQFMLNRNLIPDGFKHKFTGATQDTLKNITNIEVDIAPNRNYAILLMAKRHISGVKDWKPLAKKQFFAKMFDRGNSIGKLSARTGIGANSIRKDIRDYKFLLEASNEYQKAHPKFDEDFISYKIDPFLRVFSAKQIVNQEFKVSPTEILKLRYDDKQNTTSDLPDNIFKAIVQLIFKATIVEKTIDTRNTLFDVEGINALLDAALVNDGKTSSSSKEYQNGTNPAGSVRVGIIDDKNSNGSAESSSATDNKKNESSPSTREANNTQREGKTNKKSKSGGQTGDNSSTRGKRKSGGPTGAGDTPSTFFENISWTNKLSPGNKDHDGLIIALDELHRMSWNTTKSYGGSSTKIYCAYPVGAGMLVRTAYEQALILQLKKTGLWNPLKEQYSFPMLGNIEAQVKNNIIKVLPDASMRKAFNRIISTNSRDFLNSNVHSPWLVRATSDSLEGLASGGMFSLIQMIIDSQ
ncbi:hypothetical protein [Desulfoscipio gibsoniae]